MLSVTTLAGWPSTWSITFTSPRPAKAPILHDEFVSSEMNRIRFNQLKLVEAALAGIESGGYGQCRNCGTTISPKRLKAVPWAKYCIACEEHMRQASEPAEFGQQVA